jgi:UDP-GlcNAc:undecaprenyl-phosphate GlcNAc-1-phosphate transferase
MYSLLFLAIVSFVLSLLLTPFVRDQALRLGLVDQPDPHRKFHKLPTPRLGGVAILAATLGAYLLLLLMSLTAGHIVRSGLPFAVKLLPAVIVIFGIGLVDDIVGVRAWHKLVAQIIAAILAWTSGIHLGALGGHPFPTALSFVLTIAWIVACANALNLIDGVDGLATGIGLFAALTTLIAALLHHNIDLAFATVPLAGALLGFLRFNFNPASIFLGDCGSLTLGFLLGCYGIVWSEKSTTLFGITAPLLALSVPLLDAGLAIVRRFLCRQPIFVGDRSHIHHKLLSQGMAPKNVVLVLYGFCGLAAVASLLLTTAREQDHGFVVVLVCLACWLGLQHLGYTEFGVARKMAFGGAFRGLLSAQVILLKFEEELSTGTTIKQCAEVLCLACPQFGFSGVELCLDGVVDRKDSSEGWSVRIDFPGHGYIHLTRECDATSPGAAAVLFIDCVSHVFIRKLSELAQTESESTVYAAAD